MKSKLEYVRDWFSKAASDLKIARREMAADDAAADAVCFHFQQAAEKVLKAWLVWHDVEYRPTYNIEVLLAACEKVDPAFEQLRHIEALTPYAVEIRYADDFYMPTADEMREAADMARAAWDFVVAKLAAADVNPARGESP
jgi:HEPN domain-containing protein